MAPDVVLMDLRMPGVDGITATARILATRPATRILVLTTFDDDDHLYPALSVGASGFLAGRAFWKEAVDLDGPDRYRFLADEGRRRLDACVEAIDGRARHWASARVES